MRVIAGKAGGLPLNVPASVTRPTTDRVREALFSSLGDLVIDADVLDLYSGSGALGLEALSRGARSVIFVEEDAGACETIRKNLAKTRLETDAQVTVRHTSVSHFLETLSKGMGGTQPGFDLIFADPPYARDATTRRELTALLSQAPLVTALRPDGVFVIEARDRDPLAFTDPPLWQSLRARRYGDTWLHYLTPAA